MLAFTFIFCTSLHECIFLTLKLNKFVANIKNKTFVLAANPKNIFFGFWIRKKYIHQSTGGSLQAWAGCAECKGNPKHGTLNK